MYKSNIVKWQSGSLNFSGGCVVMGVLNVTPDSFSDGGEFFDTEKAVEQGIRMAEDGAAIIDVGGESTRPGAEPVSAKEQIRRVVPVIRNLKNQIDIPISIDAHSRNVAEAALDAGAAMINDVTALSDKNLAVLSAERQIPIVLMHMKGKPRTMQKNPQYKNLVSEVKQYLVDRADFAHSFGIKRDSIFIDPGIGFGKTTEHNLLLLKNIQKFVATGYRVLVGPSRKRFIGKITRKQKPSDRLFGTAATVALCVAAGVSIVRVHDVPQILEVVKITKAIKNAEEKGQK